MFNQRESIRTDEQLDEALEEFERFWSSDVRYLPDFVFNHDEVKVPLRLAELIRADIDRRYSSNLDVDLRGYFACFPELSGSHKLVAAIGFEDFRSRRSRSLSVDSHRWSWMPGIEQASWFVEILASTSHAVASNVKLSKARVSFTGRGDETGDPLAVHNIPVDSEEPTVGHRFGDFQLLAILGKGAFSTVFLATQLGLASRYVALKVVRRPLDEPKHLAKLQHTGIVPLYSLHRIGPYSALCMPYFGSATLADWFGSSDHPSRDGQSLVGTVQSAQMRLTSVDDNDECQPLNATEIDNVRVWNAAGAQPLEKLRSLDARHSILWLAQRLTAALAHAHERGIIHGDLKPANVLIRNDGEPALIDFNLSKSFEQEAVAWAGGTLPYMSPEQLQVLLGQTAQVDARSDVYSMGIILYELIENRLPFSPPLSQAESDIKIAIDNRKNPAAMNNSTATAGLQAIVQKCLSFSLHERYSSALPLLEDIEREVALRPLLHTKESLVTGRIPKLVRRNPRLFSAGPIALISLLVIGLAMSVAVVGWKRSKVLDAQARLGTFRDESKALLSEMVNPTQTRWEPLLSKSNRLTSQLLVAETRSISDISEQQVVDYLKWLGPDDREAAQADLVEFTIVATALICSSESEVTAPERQQLQQLISLCAGLPDTVKFKKVLDALSELVMSDEVELQARYESIMRSLGENLATIDSSELQHALIQLLLARTEVRHGQAIQAMQRLHSIKVKDVPPHLYWMVTGDAQLQLKQLEAAIQSFGLAIQADPKSVVALVHRAETLMQLRMFKPAEADLSAAIALSPSASTLFMRRALVREESGDIVGAINDMDAALDLEPESNRMLLARARLHHRANRRDEYLSDFKRGITTTPKVVDDWISRAIAQLPRYPQKAKGDLEAALQINPNSITALQNLAHVESEHLHDLQAAMIALGQILELNPENEAARAGRCVLLARQNQVQECLQDLDLLSRPGQKLLATTLYQMACAHALIMKQNEASSEEALRLLAEAIRSGYGADFIASDPDLDQLREHESFKSLLSVSKLIQTKN